MYLREYLPLHLQRAHAVPSLENGVILKIYLTIVTPPKFKRVIIVGESPDQSQLAIVYINSKINKRVHKTREARRQQKYFDTKDREYLDKPSFVDCTKLVMIEKTKVQKVVRKKPSRVIGWLSNPDFDILKEKILASTTIKGKYKNKFGFYA